MTTQNYKTFQSALNKELTLKSGASFQKGTKYSVQWENDIPHLTIPGWKKKIRVSNKWIAREVGVIAPSMEDLEEDEELRNETPLGNYTDPDGTDEYGAPTWLQIYGLI